MADWPTKKDQSYKENIEESQASPIPSGPRVKEIPEIQGGEAKLNLVRLLKRLSSLISIIIERVKLALKKSWRMHYKEIEKQAKSDLQAKDLTRKEYLRVFEADYRLGQRAQEEK